MHVTWGVQGDNGTAGRRDRNGMLFVKMGPVKPSRDAQPVDNRLRRHNRVLKP